MFEADLLCCVVGLKAPTVGVFLDKIDDTSPDDRKVNFEVVAAILEIGITNSNSKFSSLTG